jgi:hypothetical protein
MDYKTFTKAITAYKAGNFTPLQEIIYSVDKIDLTEWYNLSDLMLEQRAFNMPVGDYYIEGTLNIFHEALLKADRKEGKLSFDKKVAIGLLAEEAGDFSNFLNLYIKNAVGKHDYTLSSTFIGINTGQPGKLWNDFFYIFLEAFDTDDFNDQAIHNIATNVNKIFDLDKKQHKSIMKAIEFPHYPQGNVLEQMLDYVINFDKYPTPKQSLNLKGKNQENTMKCKKIANILQKVELEKELAKTEKVEFKNKPNKI